MAMATASGAASDALPSAPIDQLAQADSESLADVLKNTEIDAQSNAHVKA